MSSDHLSRAMTSKTASSGDRGTLPAATDSHFGTSGMKAGNGAGDSGTFPSATHQAMPDPTNTNLERDASSVEMSDLKDDCMTNLASKFTLTHLEDAEEGLLTPLSESQHPSSRPPSKFELHIADWATLKNAKSSVVSGLETVVEILEVFIGVALANKLAESPAVDILRIAKGTAEKAQKLSPSESLFPDLAMNDRIAERVISLASFDFRYRDDVVKGVPLWNMFDALTYVYTACVADIFTTRECELYLYQLRTIFGILGRAVGGYFGFTVPSTDLARGERRALLGGFCGKLYRKRQTDDGKGPQKVRGCAGEFDAGGQQEGPKYFWKLS
jgi:hypothetical protein